MATKLEYLKRAIGSTIINNLSWYFNCFSILILKEETNYDDKPILSIVTKQDGLYFIDTDQQGNRILSKIVDYKKDEPLFIFQDIVSVDSTWHPHIKTPMETKIGVLIVNILILYKSVHGKIPYINSSITVGMIENIMLAKVVDVGNETADSISIDEMNDCFSGLTFLNPLSHIVSLASSPKLITPPTNIKNIRAALLKEYEGKLSDPVKVVELENKLTAVDEEYLKDDLVAQKTFTPKARIARKKMYLLYGSNIDFVQSANPDVITNTLLDGLDPKDFPGYVSDLRAGGYGRGNATKMGGVTYKVLQRTLAGMSISPTECHTTVGLKRLITKGTSNNLIGRYIKVGAKWALVSSKDEATSYIDKIVEIRSSMYCTSKGNTICYKCMNEQYKDNTDAITTIMSDISGTLLSIFMKLMHATKTESVAIRLTDLCT